MVVAILDCSGICCCLCSVLCALLNEHMSIVFDSRYSDCCFNAVCRFTDQWDGRKMFNWVTGVRLFLATIVVVGNFRKDADEFMCSWWTLAWKGIRHCLTPVPFRSFCFCAASVLCFRYFLHCLFMLVSKQVSQEIVRRSSVCAKACNWGLLVVTKEVLFVQKGVIMVLESYSNTSQLNTRELTCVQFQNS